MEHGFLCCSSWKFAEHLNIVFHFFKAIFVSGLRGRFLVNGLICTNGNGIPEWCPELPLPFAQVVNNLFLKTVYSK